MISLGILFDEKFNKLQSLECAPVRSSQDVENFVFKIYIKFYKISNSHLSHGYTNGLYHANYCWERIGNVSNAEVLDSHIDGGLTDFPLRFHKLFPYGSFKTIIL